VHQICIACWNDQIKMDDLTEYQATVLMNTMIAMTSIGLVGSSLVIITYVKFKRKFPHTLALIFSIASWFLSFFLLLAPIVARIVYPELQLLEALATVLETHKGLCQIQAFGIQFWGSVLIWWFFLIALDLYMVVVLKKMNTSKYFSVIMGIAWSCCLILALLPFTDSQYGSLQLWCWIKMSKDGIWEFSLFYGEMAIFSAIALFMWIRVTITAVQVSKMIHINSTNHSYLVRHIMGVILFVVIFAVMFAHRVDIIFHLDSSFGLLYIHTFCLCGVGLMDFFCFGLTRGNIALWKDTILATFRKQKYEAIVNSNSGSSSRAPLVTQKASRPNSSVDL